MITSTRLIVLLALALLPSACYSAAPPVRMSHPGAPGRVGQGTIDAALAVAGNSGGPSLGYGITDAVAVEAGAESDFDDHVIGWLGVRYTPLQPGRRKFAFVLDLEGGAGAGVGGDRCVGDICSSDEQDLRRPAGGGYFGVGIGGKVTPWFWPYLRVREQLSGAEGVPLTSRTTAVGGFQFSIFETAHIWIGTGAIYLITSEGNDGGGWLPVDAGLSLTFGGWRQREALEQQRLRRERRAEQGAGRSE